MTSAGGRIDVVVPAHNEQALIGACLEAVADDSHGLDVRVIVAANGCDDDTAEVARKAGALVLDLPVASKPAALNAANAHLRGGPVIHLDADTVLTPGTVPALLAAMETAQGPVMVGPRPVLVRPRGWLSRGFAAVWSRLPSVSGEVIGGGCYAVNAAGRQRWEDFPDVIADDGYVRSLFAAEERVVVDAAGFLLVLPAGAELSRVLARWRQGNAELGVAASPAAGGRRNARAVLRAPELWRHVPAFVWVQATSRLRRRRRWARADSIRAAAQAVQAQQAAEPGDLVAVGEAGELRALAARFPAAGVYAGPMARPSLRRAIGIGLGVVGLDRQALLIRRDLLERLGGADPRFGTHGAAVDLCLRAQRAGFPPVSIPLRPAGPPTEDLLRDEQLLHRKHLPAWTAWLARRALGAKPSHRRPARRTGK